MTRLKPQDQTRDHQLATQRKSLALLLQARSLGIRAFVLTRDDARGDTIQADLIQVIQRLDSEAQAMGQIARWLNE